MLTTGVSAPAANSLLTVTFAAGVPAFWISGRVVDRVRNAPSVISILVAFSLGVLALTVVRGTIALVAASALVGYAIHCLFPALDTDVISSLPAESPAATYAASSGISLTVEATGTGVVGVLIGSQVPFETIFQTLSGCVVAVALLLATLHLGGWLPSPTVSKA